MEKRLKWEYLPREIKEVMLMRQSDQNVIPDLKVFKRELTAGQDEGGFDWAVTPEGNTFWKKVLVDKDLDHFYTCNVGAFKAQARWDGIPKEIQERMLEHQESNIGFKAKCYFKKSVSSGGNTGFTWSDTIEGMDFWSEVLTDKRYNVFFDKYPKVVESTPTRLPDEHLMTVGKGYPFKPGDKVRLTSTRPIMWCSEGRMDRYLGRVVTLKTVTPPHFNFEGSTEWRFKLDCIVGVIVKTSEGKEEVKQIPKIYVGESGNYEGDDALEVLEKYFLPNGYKVGGGKTKKNVEYYKAFNWSSKKLLQSSTIRGWKTHTLNEIKGLPITGVVSAPLLDTKTVQGIWKELTDNQYAIQAEMYKKAIGAELQKELVKKLSETPMIYGTKGEASSGEITWDLQGPQYKPKKKNQIEVAPLFEVKKRRAVIK